MMAFLKGSCVEVSNTKTVHKRSYFVAIILETPQSSSKGHYLVQYCGLLKAWDNSTPLTEYVDWTSLRPLPPLCSNLSLGFGDVVDAWYNKGWWKGTIASHLKNSKSFEVVLDYKSLRIVVNRPHLRPHFDWVTGKWFCPKLQGWVPANNAIDISSSGERRTEASQLFCDLAKRQRENAATSPPEKRLRVEAAGSMGAKHVEMSEIETESAIKGSGSNLNVTAFPQKGSCAEVSGTGIVHKGSYFAATILENPSLSVPPWHKKKGDYLVQYCSLLTGDNSRPLTEYVDRSSIRPVPPLCSNELLGVGDIVDGLYKKGWWKGTIISVFEESKSFLVVLEYESHPIKFDRPHLRPHFDWVNGNWVGSKKQELTPANNVTPQPEGDVTEISNSGKEKTEASRHLSPDSSESCQLEKVECSSKNLPLHIVCGLAKMQRENVVTLHHEKRLKVGGKNVVTFHHDKGLKVGGKDVLSITVDVGLGSILVEMANEAKFSVCSAVGSMGAKSNHFEISETEGALKESRLPKSKESDSAGVTSSEQRNYLKLINFDISVVECDGVGGSNYQRAEIPIFKELGSEAATAAECADTSQHPSVIDLNCL